MITALKAIFTAIWEFIRGVKRCPYCNEKMQHLNDSVNGIYICKPCMHPVDFFMPCTLSENGESKSPALTIRRIQDGWNALSQEHKELKHKFEAMEAKYSKDRLDWTDICASLRTDIQYWKDIAENREKRLQEHKDTIAAREAEIRGLETKVKQIEKGLAERVATEKRLTEEIQQHKDHDITVRLPLLEALRHDLRKANETIERMSRGDFTQNEIQNLCHNLLCANNYSAFTDGCAEYQMKLFGKSERTALKEEVNRLKQILKERTALKEEVNRLKQILKVWDKAGEAAIRAYGIEHETAKNVSIPKETQESINNLLDLAKAGEKSPFQMVQQDAEGKVTEIKSGYDPQADPR